MNLKARHIVAATIVFVCIQTAAQESTADFGALKNFDCALRVHGTNNSYIATNGEKNIKIPSSSVLQIKNDGFIEIRTQWVIGGINIIRVLLPYSKNEANKDKNLWSSYSTSQKQILTGSTYNALFLSDFKRLMNSLVQRYGKNNITAPKDGHRTNILMVDNPETPAIDGYQMEEWNAISEATQMIYICALTAKQAN